MKQKQAYLLLTLIGFVLPNIFVFKVSIETGNILFYGNIMQTVKGMFANDISTAFMLDLFFVLALFLVWSYQETKRLHIKKTFLVWIWTFAFGLASGLPLFLYFRERSMEKAKNR